MANTNVKKVVIDLLRGTKAATGFYGLGDVGLNTDSILSDIYGPEYTDTDRADIQSNFASFSMGQFVRGEHIRQQQFLPCICVIRAGESEQRTFLGRALGRVNAGGLFQTGQSRGSIHRENLRLEVRTSGADAPDIRDKIYMALRWVVTQGMHYLHQNYVIAPTWSDGQDGQLPGEQKNQIIQMASGMLRYQIERRHTHTVERNGNAVHSNFEDHGGGVTPQELIDRD